MASPRLLRVFVVVASLTLASCAGALQALEAIPNMDAGQMGCNNVPATEAGVKAVGEPTDPGQVFAGEDLQNADATVLAARGEAAGFVIRYRLQYATSADGVSGFGECWCVPPPDGQVTGAFYGAEGQLFIELRRSAILGGRRQPLVGWAC